MDLSSLRREIAGNASNAAQRASMQRMGKTSQVKNRAPAPVQITAEQILREAQEFKEDIVAPPRQQITDPAELREYQGRKRKEFEDAIRRNRQNVGVWMRYAQWEAKMEDFARARSVYERAIDVDYRNPSMWLRYAEMEMKNRQINHARNIWDRAVTLLPRIDQFWYKYAYMEEMLGEIDKARVIFERWMEFKPNQQAWLSYIKLELRHKQIARARALYERFTVEHLTLDAYLKHAKFETRYGSIALARQVYERAQVELTEEDLQDEAFYIAFAQFEERNKEYDRARCIYQYALDHLPKHRAAILYEKYVAFEKSYGDKEGIELVILSKRRFQYEEEIKNAAAAAAGGNGGVYNYDIFFDYLRLEQDRLEAIQNSPNPAVNTPANIVAQKQRIRELYERAVANIPLVMTEKKYWKRYIYLWIYWLVFEELYMNDPVRVREIGNKLLGGSASGQTLIPHHVFSFAKLWLHLAKFEVRQGDLSAARKRLGEALGKTKQHPQTQLKIFKGYLALELQLGALDRVRTLYEKLVEYSPERSESWLDFAAFETRLQEPQRARALYELAIVQQQLDTPEKVWKAFIEFELGQGELNAVRALYDRLLEKTKHVKVWVSAAQFESGQKEYGRARAVFHRAEEYFKSHQTSLADAERVPGVAAAAPSAVLLAVKEERLALLQAWRDFERTYGSQEEVAAVTAKLPQQLKKRKPIMTTDPVTGEEVPAGFEEYYDYIFPEEQAKTAASGLQLMERAKMWKRQQEMKRAAEQARLEAEVEREEREREENERRGQQQEQNSPAQSTDDADMAPANNNDARATSSEAQPGAASMED